MRSISIDVDDDLGRRLRRFLRQVVSDAAGDVADTASGNADIVAAKALEPTIGAQYANYGVAP